MIGTLDPTNRKAVVVGGGVTGLLISYQLAKSGFQVVLHEKSNRLGGLIQTAKLKYGIAESAVHTFLASGKVSQFIQEIGVDEVTVRPESRSKYILRNGRLRKLPLSLWELTQTLYKVSRPIQDRSDVTFQEWGESRLGVAATQWLVEPGLTGILGTRADQIEVQAFMPDLVSLDQQRSLFQILKELRKGRKSGKGKMTAPLGGMSEVIQRLVSALESDAGVEIVLSSDVSTITDNVNQVICTPAAAAAKLTGIDELSSIRYTPLISVTVILKKDGFNEGPPLGVGVLIPKSENQDVLGILFTSSSFTGRVVDENEWVSMTCLMGGGHHTDAIQWSDELILEKISKSLESIFKYSGLIEEYKIHRWAQAIPIYSKALREALNAVRERWANQPGRILAGNYTGDLSFRSLVEASLSLSSK